MRYLLGLAVLVSAVAQSGPVANLVLACPDENAIGRAGVDSCRGYVYQLPTNERIVTSGSNQTHFWRRVGDLIGADRVLVCTIPVEPGKYSSCRDATGVRRTAFVPKDSIIGGSVTVDKTGADYTDPVRAAQNAFAGDTWCVASQGSAQPCVMAIGDGVFILDSTLSIPEGLVVSGAGKGATMLVADNGVETAVTSLANVRLTDLTIINSQTGGARTIGLKIDRSLRAETRVELHDVAIHVAGAAQNVAVVRGDSVEILDSEITAVGQDATGISAAGASSPNNGTHVWLERSHVSAETALHEEYTALSVGMRLIDSRISGNIFFDPENGFQIIGTEVIGNVQATNDFMHLTITDSSIKGGVEVAWRATITDTSMEGGFVVRHGTATFDGFRLQGELVVSGAYANVLHSYIDASGTGAALSLQRDSGFSGDDSHVQLKQTFVQGAQALAVEAGSRLESSSSVLAGAVSADVSAVLSCTDTFGADYELLSVSCQPQTR
jgi:hypothetical protein